MSARAAAQRLASPRTVSPLAHESAAEITGVDCSRPLGGELAGEIGELFLTYPILVFRDQPLTGAQFAAFAENFGELESFGDPPPLPKPDESILRPDTPFLPERKGRTAPNFCVYYHPDDPRVQFITNEERRDMPLMGIQDNAEKWHSDAQYRLHPNKITLLNTLIPPSSGGQTVYADLTLLFEALPQLTQNLLKACRAVHQWSKSRNFLFVDLLDPAAREEGDRIAALVPSMRHPLVRRHPDTGRPILFVSPRFTIAIDGLESAASEMLLRELFALMDDPRFVYSHSWRKNDIVMWDNRRIAHHGCEFPQTDIRHFNSITLCGEQPLAM